MINHISIYLFLFSIAVTILYKFCFPFTMLGISMDQRIIESGYARNRIDGIEQKTWNCTRFSANAMA